MANIIDAAISILKSDPRFISEEGDILKNVVFDAIHNNDSSLLKSIYANEELRKHFFTKISDGIEVFNQEAFGWLINNKQFLPDSFTRFSNKIGLTINDDPIGRNGAVVLSFPYKDCILEGGQSKLDAKRGEVFYNKILTPDKIDSLLAPKVLDHPIRIAKEGETEVNQFNNDNLIIRGNNLLGLSSILKRYEGKVRCIYIDPPYYFATNKSEDTFLYNSNFKLSTWLVFMKNRLEIAKRLLSDDGAIFVQISDDGVAELHILMKEIFGPSNFINKITVKTRSPSGFASVNPGVFESAEYILAFAKNKPQWKFKKIYVESAYDSNYKWVVTNLEQPYNEWKIESIADIMARVNGFSSPAKAIKEMGEDSFNQLVAKYAASNPNSVFRTTVINNNASADTVRIRDLSKENRNVIYKISRNDHYDIFVRNGEEMAFYSKKIRNIDGKNVPSIELSNIWIDTPYEGIATEGGVKLKGGKKPEKLIKRILELSTEPGDIVLDFFLGSGTTCAVAHKMGRQYIGIEQLDYGDNDCLKRLKAVIDGDKSGISKNVGWNGGGSFIYCELRQLNMKFIDRLKTSDSSDIVDLYKDVISSPYIITDILPSRIDESLDDFQKLTLDNQKKTIAEILDANMLYVNLQDIDDTTYDIPGSVKDFNRSFYG